MNFHLCTSDFFRFIFIFFIESVDVTVVKGGRKAVSGITRITAPFPRWRLHFLLTLSKKNFQNPRWRPFHFLLASLSKNVFKIQDGCRAFFKKMLMSSKKFFSKLQDGRHQIKFWKKIFYQDDARRAFLKKIFLRWLAPPNFGKFPRWRIFTIFC